MNEIFQNCGQKFTEWVKSIENDTLCKEVQEGPTSNREEFNASGRAKGLSLPIYLRDPKVLTGCLSAGSILCKLTFLLETIGTIIFWIVSGGENIKTELFVFNCLILSFSSLERSTGQALKRIKSNQNCSRWYRCRCILNSTLSCCSLKSFWYSLDFNSW